MMKGVSNIINDDAMNIVSDFKLPGLFIVRTS
jgi:hypothetical protein